MGLRCYMCYMYMYDDVLVVNLSTYQGIKIYTNIISSVHLCHLYNFLHAFFLYFYSIDI